MPCFFYLVWIILKRNSKWKGLLYSEAPIKMWPWDDHTCGPLDFGILNFGALELWDLLRAVLNSLGLGRVVTAIGGMFSKVESRGGTYIYSEPNRLWYKTSIFDNFCLKNMPDRLERACLDRDKVPLFPFFPPLVTATNSQGSKIGWTFTKMVNGYW